MRFLTRIAILYVLLHISVAFLPGGAGGDGDDGGDRPWWNEKNKGDEVTTIPEDNIILYLSKNKFYNLTCPSQTTDDAADELFATWYFKKKDTDKEREILYIQSRYDFPTMRSLLIENLNIDDEGLYSCYDGQKFKGQNAVKKFRIIVLEELETTKSPAHVDPPVWVNIPPHIVRATSSNYVIAQCTTVKKHTKVQIYRLKDDGTVYKQYKENHIVIHRPAADDTGKYMCVAINSAGKIEHRFEIEVMVNGKWGNWNAWGPCDVDCGYGYKTRNRACDNPPPAGGGRQCDGQEYQKIRCRDRSCQKPRMTKFGYEITKEVLILNCGAAGIPTPTVQWFYNGRAFPSHYDSKNTVFKIPRNKARRGSYSCKIRNDVGFITTYIDITV